jgi:hypothetical protein
MIPLINHDSQWGRSEVVIIYPDTIPIFMYTLYLFKNVGFLCFSFYTVYTVCLHEFWKLEKNSDLIHAPVPRRGCVEPVQVLLLSDCESQSRSLVTKI